MEWVEKPDTGIKRKTRITFLGNGTIKWQFKRSDQDAWDYDTPPTPSDWATLLQKVEALYHRRRMPLKYLERVRSMKSRAEQT